MDMKKEKSAGAVVYYLEGSEPMFLLLKYKTYWGFAKGWIEPGETEEQAAKREIKEEANLNVSFIPGFKRLQKWFFRHEGEFIAKEAVFFLAKISKQEAESVKISDEHEDFEFVSYKESLNFIKIKSNRNMLKSADDFIHEIQKQKTLL